MNEKPVRTYADFVQTLQSLDPAFSYMVFESPMSIPAVADFSAVFDILARLNTPVLGNDIHQDPDRRRHLLIVKMGAEVRESIMQEILEAGLSNQFTYYFYRSFQENQKDLNPEP
jgi:hypothetical protein